MMKDHNKKHPVRERELNEFVRGSRWLEFGNKVSHAFNNNTLNLISNWSEGHTKISLKRMEKIVMTDTRNHVRKKNKKRLEITQTLGLK